MEQIKSTISIEIKNPESNWVALDLNNPSKVLYEAVTPEEVVEDAIKKGYDYTLSFVPKENENYIL
jgi:hypothetical protein